MPNDTIRNRLHKHYVHPRIPVVKERPMQSTPGCTTAHQPGTFWGRVIFSDKKTVSSTTRSTPLLATQRNKIRSRNIYGVARSGHVTSNTWGPFIRHEWGEVKRDWMLKIEGSHGPYYSSSGYTQPWTDSVHAGNCKVKSKCSIYNTNTRLCLFYKIESHV